MPAMSSSWSFMILRGEDGSVDVLNIGELGAGTIVQNPRKLTVSGPGTAHPPKQHMSAAEYQAWLTTLRSGGFQVTEDAMG